MSKLRDVESGIRRLLNEVRDIRAENAALAAMNAEMLGALKSAEMALVDLGACNDSECRGCGRILQHVIATIAKAERQP